jgi:hypothetical protein
MRPLNPEAPAFVPLASSPGALSSVDDEPEVRGTGFVPRRVQAPAGLPRHAGNLRALLRVFGGGRDCVGRRSPRASRGADVAAARQQRPTRQRRLCRGVAPRCMRRKCWVVVLGSFVYQPCRPRDADQRAGPFRHPMSPHPNPPSPHEGRHLPGGAGRA